MYSGQRQIVNVGPSGPLRDYRSPEQAGRNAALPYQQISQFLDNFVKTAKPVYDAYVSGQVAKERATIMAQPEMLDAYRRGDEQARSFIGALRPQTRDFVNNSVADAGVEQYQRTLPVLVTRDPVLTGAPPEGVSEQEFAKTKALRFKQLEEQAAQQAGFETIDPEWLGTKIPQIQQVNAATKAFAYGKQVEALDKRDSDAMARGMGSRMFELNERRVQAVQNNRYQDFASGLDEWWGRNLDQWQETRTPQQILEITWQGFSQRYNELLQGGELADVDAADQLIATATALSLSSVKLKSGETLGQMSFSDGSSLGSKLAELRLKLRPMREKLEEDARWQQTMPLFQQAMQPGASDQVRAQASAMLPSVFSDPRQMMQAYSMLNQAGSIADQATQAQQQTMALLQMELNKDGLSYEQKKNLVLSTPGLTWEQRLKFAPQVQSEPGQEARTIAGARSYNQLEIQQSGEQVAQALAAAKAQGRLNPGVQVPDADTAARDAAIAATRMTEQRVQQMQEEGKMPSADETAAIFRNELDAYTRSQLRQAGEAARQRPQNFAAVVTGELDIVRQNLMRNGGQTSVEVFPEAVRQRAAQQGYPNTYIGVQRYFLNRMKSALEDDGQGGQKQVFPDPAKVYRETMKSVKGGEQAQIAPQQGFLRLDNYPGFVGLRKMGEGLQWLVERTGMKDRYLQQQGGSPKPQTSAKPQETSRQPQQNASEQLIGGALNLLVGASPAAAGEMPKPGASQPQRADQATTVGLENIPVLAELMKLPGRAARALGIGTPVLPQTAATVPVRPVPLAINNDMHPLFVAIGINEGTRTPNGGYTKAYYGHRDPGNGAFNVGTVSGQQGGSPQTSDQRWAGILTQAMTSVTPILVRSGLPQNSVGFQRMLFNIADLKVQAPAAVPDFVKRLPQIVRQGVTIEAIAKARADSFINPATGRLEAAGFGNNYQTLLRDQRSRAGTWDYKRRL
jgi:hypothetical protein